MNDERCFEVEASECLLKSDHFPISEFNVQCFRAEFTSRRAGSQDFI
jgi:hypothetical protein